MAKVAVYEGCPACSTSYGALPAGLNTQEIMSTLQSAAVGGAAGLVAEMVATKFLKITNPIMRAAVVLGTPIAVAAFVKDKNPQMAQNIALGGAAVGIYSLLKGFIGGGAIAPTAGYSGYGAYGALPEVIVEEENPENELGMLVAEEQDTSGLGVLVAEEEPAYGQEVYIEE